MKNPDYEHQFKSKAVEYIKRAAFLVPFLDDKSKDYDISLLFKIVYNSYKPIARGRLRSGLLGFMAERKIAQLIRRSI